MVNGTLISFEGPEGAGKSSVLEAILPLLEEKGIPFITTREPGGVDIAEKIRQVILDPDHTSMDAKTELLLYIASRRQHLVERVLPALAAGKVVLMDRFIDSSVAYQGYGRGLSVEDIEWLNQFATDGLKPDLTLYLSGCRRRARTNAEKPRAGSPICLDLEGLELHQKVRQGYLALYEKEPERIVKIDASQSFEAVFTDVLTVLENRLGTLK